MANQVKGEVDFMVGEKTFTLKLGNNARAEAEAVVGKPWVQIATELFDAGEARQGTARAVLWAGLRRFHPELSLLDVGDMMDEVGDTYAGQKIGEALIAAAPKDVIARPPTAESPPTGTSN